MSSFGITGSSEQSFIQHPPPPRWMPIVAVLLIILGLGGLGAIGAGLFLNSLVTVVVGSMVGIVLLITCLFALVIKGIVMCSRYMTLAKNAEQH